MVRVTLIYKERVAKELNNLDRAKAMPQDTLRSMAISVAKKQVRNAASISDIGNPTTKDLTAQQVASCRKHLIDVGENTFVFDEKTIKSVFPQLPAWVLAVVKAAK